jgi:hypothetical protein
VAPGGGCVGATFGFAGDVRGFAGETFAFARETRGFAAETFRFAGEIRGFAGEVRGFVRETFGFAGEFRGFAGKTRGFATEVRGFAGEVDASARCGGKKRSCSLSRARGGSMHGLLPFNTMRRNHCDHDERHPARGVGAKL